MKKAHSVLPRGPHGLSRREVINSQQSRILDAVTAIVAEQGYSATKVREISSRAGVSLATFYELFGDKETCFLCAYDAVADGLLDAIASAVSRTTSLIPALRGGIEAYCRWFDDHPSAAVTFLIEIRAAGDIALDRRAQVISRFEDLIWHLVRSARKTEPVLAGVRRECVTAFAATVDALAYERVRTDGPSQLSSIVPSAVYISAVLFAGREAAATRRTNR